MAPPGHRWKPFYPSESKYGREVRKKHRNIHYQFSIYQGSPSLGVDGNIFAPISVFCHPSTLLQFHLPPCLNVPLPVSSWFSFGLVPLTFHPNISSFKRLVSFDEAKLFCLSFFNHSYQDTLLRPTTNKKYV